MLNKHRAAGLSIAPASTLFLICAGLLALYFQEPAEAQNGIALPVYKAGTTFIYSNGSWETVEAVRGDQITWRNHRNRVSVGTRDFSYRRQQWETGKRRGTRLQRPRHAWLGRTPPVSVWPLAVGNQARYIETGRWQEKGGGWRTYTAQWRSEVEGRERIRTMAGEFDTYRIVNRRYSVGRIYGRGPRLRERRIWYYAPAVGHYVRYIKDYRGRKPTRQIDLVSVRPPLDDLKASVRTAIDNNFQLALEKKRSGQKLAWNLPRQAASGTTQPTATFRTAANRFCRQYVQRINLGRSDQTYYGMACRDRKGQWRTPHL